MGAGEREIEGGRESGRAGRKREMVGGVGGRGGGVEGWKGGGIEG